MFSLDKKFVRELHARLQAANKSFFGKRNQEKIPSVVDLREILSKVFWASTQFEEGRPSKFRVTYSLPIGIQHLSLRFNLGSAKLWAIHELVKLAPAVVPPDGNICVYPFMGTLYIQGLHTSSLTAVTFEILDSARVVVRFPLRSVIAELTGERAEFIDKDWNTRVLELLCPYSPSVGGQLADMISILYGDVVKETLNRIRRLNHGGTLLIVPDDSQWRKSIEKPIAFECEQRYNGVQHIEESLTSELTSASNVVQRAMEVLARPTFVGAIGDTSRTLAYLSGIDGAVMLAQNLDVLAFGVKVREKQKSKSETVVRRMPYEGDPAGETSLTDAFRGKRHLSTARFVLDNPLSKAFTVSQDGGVTAFVMEGEVLHAYKGLELLL